GIMPLDRLYENGIDYAICTDVGASPTTSILNEMSQFLKVHAGRSTNATPTEALHRSTLAASQMIGLGDEFGLLEAGKPTSFIEVDPGDVNVKNLNADDAIARAMLGFEPRGLDRYRTGDMRRALDVLESGAIDAGPELDMLCADVDRTVARVDA